MKKGYQMGSNQVSPLVLFPLQLNLSHNALTGSMPWSQSWALQASAGLDLSRNNLSGGSSWKPGASLASFREHSHTLR
jgi:hypothetical protein